MRHHSRPSHDAPANQGTRNDWATLKTLFPYLWQWKWRVLLALACLVLAKLVHEFGHNHYLLLHQKGLSQRLQKRLWN